MINQAKITIPYPKKIGFISFNTKKTINFSFDNLSLFLFQQRHNLKSLEDFEKWKKDKGSFDYLIHSAYSAAESYCIHNRLKFDLDIKKFALGFAQTDEKELEKLITTWKTSSDYGFAELPGKKKVKVKSSAIRNNTPTRLVNVE